MSDTPPDVAPQNLTSRTAAVKRAIREAGLPPVKITTVHGVHHVSTVLHGVPKDGGDAYADVLDGLGWGKPVDRSYLDSSGFVSLAVDD